MIRLNVFDEWRTAGGFHSLCERTGISPQVTVYLQRRMASESWTTTTSPSGWFRMRLQGTVDGPARWMLSWMPGSFWDQKFSNPTPHHADLTSFAWAAHQGLAQRLIIERAWTTWQIRPTSLLSRWGPELPVFYQTVTTNTGDCWERAWGILNPPHWTTIPSAQTTERFAWTL